MIYKIINKNVANNDAQEKLGIMTCLVATVIFASQDAITKHLTHEMPAPQFVMIRFWVFLLFALVFANQNGGIAVAFKTAKLSLQIVRSLLLILQIILFAFGVRYLTLPDMHALFVLFPIFTTILAVPVLGEKIGLRRTLAVCIGFLGALIILRPGSGIFGWQAVFPIGCALLFSIYNLLTRITSYQDSYTCNILYVALIGAIVSTILGVSVWQPIQSAAIPFILMLCITGVAGHVLLMKALEYTPASVLQPFNYFTLVWAIILGFIFFNDFPDTWTLTGAGVIVLTGLYILNRSRTT